MADTRTVALDPTTPPPAAGAGAPPPAAAGSPPPAAPARRASAPESRLPDAPPVTVTTESPPRRPAPAVETDAEALARVAAERRAEEVRREEAALEREEARSEVRRREREEEALREARRRDEAARREREVEEARLRREREAEELLRTEATFEAGRRPDASAPTLVRRPARSPKGSGMEELDEAERLLAGDDAEMRETPLSTPKPKQARSTLMILLGKANETKANYDEKDGTWSADPSLFRQAQYPTLLKPILDALANGKGTSFALRSNEAMFPYPEYAAPRRFTLDVGKQHYPMAVIEKALPKAQAKPAAASSTSSADIIELPAAPKKDAELAEYYVDAFRHFKDKAALGSSPSCIVSIEFDMTARELMSALQDGTRFDQAKIVAIHTNKNAGWQVKGEGAGAAYSVPVESIFPLREQVKKDLDAYLKHLDAEVKKEIESNKKIRAANRAGQEAALKKNKDATFVGKPESHVAQEKQLIAQRMSRVLTDGRAFYQDTMAALNAVLEETISFQAQQSLPPEPKPKSENPLAISPPKPPMKNIDFLSMHRDNILIRILSWIGYGATLGFGSYLSKGYARFWQPRGQSLSLEVKDALAKDAPREDQPVAAVAAVAAPSAAPLAVAADTSGRSWNPFKRK
jgi:hypothetical protein